MMSEEETETAPEKLALDAWHRAHGARMVPFAGYEMPIQYEGIVAEHDWTRGHAGLFDVSHMGQLLLSGPDLDAAVEAVLPIDLSTLKLGQQRYSLLLDENGGVLDDLMVSRWPNHLYLVVNGATKWDDIGHLREQLPDDITLNHLEDRALLALQGPKAADALARHAEGEYPLSALTFMKFGQYTIAGHDVTVLEKADRIGGLLRYGIPDFKMSRHLIDRRMAQMQSEGVDFRPNSHVGVNVEVEKLLRDFDAMALTGGAEEPRDLNVPGRELDGIYFAMRYLTQQNRRVSGERIADKLEIMATGKHVIVIGGGDTGSDCIGTANRQGAASITQIEIMPEPPKKENKGLSWPDWPMKLYTSPSHEEGCDRDWSITTKAFEGRDGHVTRLKGIGLDWLGGKMTEVAGSEFDLPADLVLLAMGFVNPVHEGMLDGLGVSYDDRGNVAADTENYHTSIDKVFAAGDMRRGQSLVVWAIREGRQCARAIDEYLMGETNLPR